MLTNPPQPPVPNQLLYPFSEFRTRLGQPSLCLHLNHTHRKRFRIWVLFELCLTFCCCIPYMFLFSNSDADDALPSLRFFDYLYTMDCTLTDPYGRELSRCSYQPKDAVDGQLALSSLLMMMHASSWQLQESLTGSPQPFAIWTGSKPFFRATYPDSDAGFRPTIEKAGYHLSQTETEVTIERKLAEATKISIFLRILFFPFLVFGDQHFWTHLKADCKGIEPAVEKLSITRTRVSFTVTRNEQCLSEISQDSNTLLGFGCAPVLLPKTQHRPARLRLVFTGAELSIWQGLSYDVGQNMAEWLSFHLRKLS
jgi:hypothetical protein